MARGAAAAGLLGAAVASLAGGALNWSNLLFMIAWLSLNWPLYFFFARRRGLAFAAAGSFLHWLYYLNGAIGFTVGSARFWLRRLPAAPPVLREVPA
jgi:hypothetical protein